MRRAAPWLKLALPLIALVLVTVVTELALRVVRRDGYFVWPPLVSTVFDPRPGVFPGIEGPSRFFTNALGIRGDDLPDDPAYRILAVGGSTTECLYLDQDEAWPARVQQILNGRQDSTHYWIGNIGKSGLNTRHHRVQLRRLLPTLTRIDALILMVGANDLGLRLTLDAEWAPLVQPSPDEEQQLLRGAFSLAPGIGDDQPFLRRTELWRRLRTVKRKLWGSPQFAGLVQTPTGDNYVAWREHRATATRFRSELPDLGPALKEFATNVQSILDLAHERSIRVILVTQPVLWREGLTESQTRWLWMGGVGRFQVESGHEYYTPEALARAMAEYNAALLEICAQGTAECVDLAGELAHDASLYYDDMHFNERGAERVAEVIAGYIWSAR